MSTTIKTGWLKDNNGDKFAPKTLSSQVITSEGITLEESIQQKLDEAGVGGVYPDHSHIAEDIDDLEEVLDTREEAFRAEIDGSFVTKKDFDDHDHNGVFASADNVYTKEEIDSGLDSLVTKEDLENHNYDDRYMGIYDAYKKEEIDSGFVTKQDFDIHDHNDKYELIDTASILIEQHDVAAGAHNDIRESIAELVKQLTTFLGEEEETLSQVLALIDDNKNLIEGLKSSKVNVSDIIDNLTTAEINKPLSANQGYVLNQLIETLKTELKNGTFVVNTAIKLSSDNGSPIQPVYFSGGQPVETTYSLDKAGTDFGLVKSGGDVTIKDGVITVNDDSHAHITADVDGLDETLASINKDISDHKDNKNNPHNVNLEQLGVTATADELNILDGVTASTAEINKLDGLTASTTELNYVGGVTSNIQSQLDDKASSDASYTTGTGVLENTKLYMVGAQRQGSAEGVRTYTNSYVYIDTDNCLRSNGIRVSVEGHTHDLPIASSSTLGGVKVGDGLSISDGTLSADVGRKGTGVAAENFNFVEYNTASGDYSHAEGAWATASGDCSHAEGRGAIASGECSHAEGWKTTASGECSHAAGMHTIANNYQTVVGLYNDEYAGPLSYTTIYQSDGTTPGTLFIVGCGFSASSKKTANAFRVTADGQCYGQKTFQSQGADFAEHFEWLDGNPDNEDRRGKFVTLDGEKIRLATSEDDYILGAVSTTGAFIGNSSSENWQGKYMKDIFGERLTQEIEVPEKVDEVTGEVTPAHTAVQYVLNPDYDPEQEYVSREYRKEWSPVGFHGQVVVVDDGTCEVNSYCKPSVNGIATANDTGYRVMARLDDTHIKVLIR